MVVSTSPIRYVASAVPFPCGADRILEVWWLKWGPTVKGRSWTALPHKSRAAYWWAIDLATMRRSAMLDGHMRQGGSVQLRFPLLV